MYTKLLTSVLLATLSNAQDTEQPAETPQAPQSPTEATDVEIEEKKWDYKKNGGDWGEYTPFCGIGLEQSPIDLNQGSVENDKMEINGYGYQNYPEGKTIMLTEDSLMMVFNDGEFQLTYPDGSKSLFEPIELHVRSPSEHTIEGKQHDVELQIIHQYKGTQGQLGAGIAIMFDRKDGGEYDNPFLKSLQLDKAVPDPGYPLTNVMVQEFLWNIDMSRYWTYQGSLTTPPCSEGITWTVIEQIQPLSLQQMQAVASYFRGNEQFAFGKGNNREIQELNQRKVYYRLREQAFVALASITAASLATILAF